MREIVIFGSQGHAKVVADIIEKQGNFKILGFIDDYRKVGERVFGYEVIGGINYYKTLPSDVSTVIAVGENWGRMVVRDKITGISPSIEFITAVHPKATVAKNVVIGNGTVVMAGAIVNCESTIGEHCIINTKSSIGHDTTLSDFVTTAPNATIAGNVYIGKGSVISMGASVIQKRVIGEYTLVGAGSIVLSDLNSFTLAYGTPAKEIRKRTANENYL